MTARMIDAEEAARIGLVDRSVVQGSQMDAAEYLSREIARNAPLAVELAARIIDVGHGVDKATFMELGALAQSSRLLTEDFCESATALTRGAIRPSRVAEEESQPPALKIKARAPAHA